MGNQMQMLLVVFAYFAFLIIWGLYQRRKVKNDFDYAVAGRDLPGWAAARDPLKKAENFTARCKGYHLQFSRGGVLNLSYDSNSK